MAPRAFPSHHTGLLEGAAGRDVYFSTEAGPKSNLFGPNKSFLLPGLKNDLFGRAQQIVFAPGAKNGLFWPNKSFLLPGLKNDLFGPNKSFLNPGPNVFVQAQQIVFAPGLKNDLFGQSVLLPGPKTTGLKKRFLRAKQIVFEPRALNAWRPRDSLRQKFLP